MVSGHYSWYIWCYILIAEMYYPFGCCSGQTHVKFYVKLEGDYYAYNCSSISFPSIALIDIIGTQAYDGCKCELLLPEQGLLLIHDLAISTHNEIHKFNVFTGLSRKFTIGVSTNPHGYVYIQQMDHSKHWDYNFTQTIRFTNQGVSNTLSWLNCTNVPQSYIHGLAKHPTSATTTSPTVHTEPSITASTSTEHELPVSEKPRETPRKAILISIITGVSLLVVVLALVTFIICCLRRQRKSPKDIQKGPHKAVYDNANVALHGASDQSRAALVSNNDIQPNISQPYELDTQATDHVEYADIKPDSLAPVSGGDAGKPLVYADLAFHSDPTRDGNGKGQAGVGTAGAGMTEDQISQLYAKPMKRK